MTVLRSDLRFAVRELFKARGFALAAIAALALGIGPNTAIFSVVYATLLAPLPYADPDQLMMVWSKTPSGVRNSVSPGDALAWKAAATSFQYLEPFTSRLFNLAKSDEPLRVRARLVTPDGHRMLGEGIALGRDFLPEDDDPGRNHVVLFSNVLSAAARTAEGGIWCDVASVSTGLPLEGAPFGMPFHLGGTSPCTPSCPDALVRMVTPAFFETFGGAIVLGRAFTEHDTSGGVRVALVSQQFANQYLRGVDPLRQRIELNELVPGRRKPGRLVEWQIVGVFRTITNSELLGAVSRPEVILPLWQSPWPDAAVAVRTAGNPNGVRGAVGEAVRSLDPALPLVNVRTMTDIVRERFASDRRQVALYGGLAAVALLLAALGVYGVMTFSVAQRTPEIGLRMALGAAQRTVRRQILCEGLTLAVGGLALGVVGAYALGRAMQSTLFGIGAINVPVSLSVGAVLLTSALLACYVPARRASRVDPMIALRRE